jgi:predicted dehydrogenase
MDRLEIVLHGGAWLFVHPDTFGLPISSDWFLIVSVGGRICDSTLAEPGRESGGAMDVAFYGTSDRARPYLDALARRTDVRVTAVCDLDRRSAEQTAAAWGARVFLSYEAMLREARPDALWVCVAPHLQGDVLLRAVEQHVPCFVVPPGAMDFDRARLYGRLAAAANLPVAVGFPARSTDVVREAREYLGANPIALLLGWWLGPPEADESPTPSAAALLWNDACRLVDAMRYFGGEVDRVRTLPAGASQGSLVVQLEFVAGGVGVLSCAAFARPEPRVELELLGDGWSLLFGPGRSAPSTSGAYPLSTLCLAEGEKTTLLRCLNVPPAEQAAAFLDAAVAGNPSAILTGYEEALRTMAVCHAALVSARESRPVTLAEIQ